jgi:hypothetical protein
MQAYPMSEMENALHYRLLSRRLVNDTTYGMPSNGPDSHSVTISVWLCQSLLNKPMI